MSLPFSSRSSLRFLVALACAVPLAVACGSSPEAPITAQPATTTTGTGPSPVPTVDSGNPDGGTITPVPPPEKTKEDELTEAFGVFVSVTGTPDGAGTRAAPVSTIAKGIKLGKQAKKRVFVCAGTYTEALTVEDGVSILANLDCSAPQWKYGLAHAVLASPTSPAITARDISTATRIDGLDVVAPAGTAEKPSSIALLAVGSAGLTLADGKLESGAGLKGLDGVNPEPVSPVVLQLPQAKSEPGPCYSGPLTRCSSGFLMAPPRAGGEGGIVQCLVAGVEAGRSTGGRGGSSSVFNSMKVSIVSPSTGANGTSIGIGNGAAGASAIVGTFSEDDYEPANGAQGANGAVGRAGAGGNPGFAPGVEQAPPIAGYTWGYNGAGGGAGGCPGLPGTPGTGGGASVAALLRRSPVRFERMTISSGPGGAGGRGTGGTQPTPGQAQAGPAAGINALEGAYPGEAGGWAGVSGHGGGGPSIGIVHDAAGKPAVVDTKVSHGAAGGNPGQLLVDGRTIPASTPALAADTAEL
jgi:hypothetical protein